MKSVTNLELVLSGTDKNLFRLVLVPGHGVRVQYLWSWCLSLGMVPKFVLGNQKKATFRMVPGTGTKFEWGLGLYKTY